MSGRAYGWTPPPDGHRGLRARASADELDGLHIHTELAFLPPVTDQRYLGSCTGHAVATALAARLAFQSFGSWLPSSLDLYLGGRLAKGAADRDAGAILADVLAYAEREGFAPDLHWPYAEHLDDFRGPPPAELTTVRPRTRLITHEPLDWHLDTIRWELACGYPVVIGLRVYPGFEGVGADAVIPMPDGAQVGGHAVCVVGYNDTRGALLIQNSWGTSWGARGRAWLPYPYALNPFWCGEMHAIRVVRREESKP